MIFFGNNHTNNPFRNTFIPDNSIRNVSQNLPSNVYNLKNSFVPDNPFQINQRTLTTSYAVDHSKNILNTYSTYRPSPLKVPNLNRGRGKSMYLEFNNGKNFGQFRK